MPILDYLELVGVAAFAVSGATVAIRKKMDLFGVIFLAIVTAIGGGVLRDVVIDVGVPVFFQHYEYTVVILATCIFVVLLKGRIKWKRIVFFFDAVGLAVFAIYAGVKAIELHYNFLSFLFVCVITGVGGGIMRDIIAREIPMVLHREIYATAAMIGSVVLWFVYPVLGKDISTYVCIALIILIRIISMGLKLCLPFVKDTGEDLTE